MKKVTLFLFAAFAVISTQCTTAQPSGTREDVALKFMNDYAKSIMNPEENGDITAWLNGRSDNTQEFRDELKQMIETAEQEDPEMGLGFDPILNAQDIDQAGFAVAKSADAQGYVVLKGKTWQDYKVALKVVQEGNQWKIDGAGVVRIPGSMIFNQ